jgi:hypothetical protein
MKDADGTLSVVGTVIVAGRSRMQASPYTPGPV